MKTFVWQTVVVVVCVALVGWFKLMRNEKRVAGVWEEMEDQLCGERK